MDKFRTAMGILVGILIGLANGLGVKSITVGVIVLFALSYCLLSSSTKLNEKRSKSIPVFKAVHENVWLYFIKTH